jgi:N utilization substance protein B
VHEGEKYEVLIANKSKNWDLDRISDTDKILLLMAIQEMINFPGIPLKVTINEYIEVSKKYSTPKSKQFINGVLDVIAVDLQKEGVIKKSGRGLIDNK